MATCSLPAATPERAVQAVNALGLDLHRQMPRQGNLCLAPYSIQSALAMTYLGASGTTQEEMARVLHFTQDKRALGESFAALRTALEEAQKASVAAVAQAKEYGGPSEPVVLQVANQLFAQQGYEVRQPFLAGTREHFGVPLQEMNFHKNADGARLSINQWVEKQTRSRISDLIPPRALNADTRLVLVNALYFKGAWADEFNAAATVPAPFHQDGGQDTTMVPTMSTHEHLRYHKGRGFQSVAIPYAGSGLHFLLIVPDKIDGIASVEAALTPEVLLACAHAKGRKVTLHLPKFKITPPALALGGTLQKMGMRTAFDVPEGSADFDAMAPKRPDAYLCISDVFHKTFIALDEKGTEAAAATAAVVGVAGAAMDPEKPVELKADRPFLFAIQHAPSGACLFLGRVSDPR